MKYSQTTRQWLLGALTALLLTLLAVACSSRQHAAPPELPMVATACPMVRDIVLTHDIPAYLQAQRQVQLVARVSGFLLRQYYVPGQRVQTGATLFLIDPSDYKQQVNEAQASMQMAQAKVCYSKATYERTQQASLANAVAEIQVLQTQSDFQEAVASLQQMQAALELARLNLGYCEVKAPCMGHVSVNAFDVGNYLDAAQKPVLATLFKDDTIYAYFNVSEQVMHQRQQALGLGSGLDFGELRIRIPALDEGNGASDPASPHPRLARLEYVSPNVTMATGTLTLRAVMDNASGLLRDGMYVRIALPVQRLEQALLVRNASIGHNQAGAFVYVVGSDSTVRQQQVKTGPLYEDSLCVVLNGLSPSDSYVTEAQLKVHAGEKVIPLCLPSDVPYSR